MKLKEAEGKRTLEEGRLEPRSIKELATSIWFILRVEHEESCLADH